MELYHLKSRLKAAPTSQKNNPFRTDISLFTPTFTPLTTYVSRSTPALQLRMNPEEASRQY
jgi:hypothetical protein